ncbi:MAG: V-type ATP synthase subunit I [Aureliella sp.]
MTIVALDKVTLYGPAAERDVALDALQRLGRMHLVNLNPDELRTADAGPLSAEARDALKFLITCPIIRKATKRTQEYDAQKIIGQTLELKRRRELLSDERDAVGKAIEELSPWGEFRTPVDGELGPARLWFYAVPRRDEKKIAHLGAPHEIVAEDPTHVYVIALSEDQPESGPAAPVQLDPRPLSELIARRDELDEELENLHWQRVELTRWIPMLERSLDESDDRAAHQWAGRLSRKDADLFAVQGWTPRESRAEIKQVAERHGLAVTFSQPGANEQPPTLLHNPDRVAGAEGAVTFYITPAYRAWDPTPVMFVSFSLFFGMIMADAGYGLLMAAALVFFWHRLGATRTGANFRNLLLAITAATIIFGMLAGSYFGLAPRPDSPLARLRLLDFENRGQMMALSIFIGVTHLSIANAISAWRQRNSPRAIGALGWILLMFGALMMASALLQPPAPLIIAIAGKCFVLLGVWAIIFFSSDRPLNTAKASDWIGRLFDGLSSLTGISKLFGDVLSYLRLFALGLASAQLAVTFNGLASDVSQFRGLGMLLAAVILIAGHGINLILGLMGGVVHGLRLNCIEFFNWSLTEEGYPFRTFQKKVTT